MSLTPDKLAIAAGIMLSLVFSYLPGLKDWYDALTPSPKRAIMLAALFVAALGTLVYQCRGAGECYTMNFETALTAFVLAAIANQTAAQLAFLSPKRRLVRAAAVQKHMANVKAVKS